MFKNDSKKNVTIDATPFLFRQGGVGRVTEKLVSTIESFELAFELKMYARRFRGEPISVAGSTRCVKHLRLPKFCEPAMKYLGVIEAFASADLYHATDHYLPLKQSSNYIVTIHDLIFLSAPEKRWKIHEYQAAYVPDFVKNSRHVITCSEFTKKDIIEHIGIEEERISVIPWGIDHELFTYESDIQEIREGLEKEFAIGRPYFLAVACSVGRKNTQRLLQAWVEVVKRFRDFKLVLVWDPPREIIDYCKYNELESEVIFTGRVEDRILSDLYRCSECVLYPSTYEGFGLPILEAMSSGVPVITGNTSSMPEVGGDLAYYVNPFDTGDIIDRIFDVITDMPFAGEYRERLVKHAKRFNWRRCAEKTVEVYKRFL